MLQLQVVTKEYRLGESRIRALNGISLAFRESEFVSVLGPSGCGKTTLLNIIGGLDRMTDGDLMINGRSTREYTDRDWDTYRNHSIGFVFQNYHLIPHQTVLTNVELALTIAGISKDERRRRAVEALESVGLGDQLEKMPNQISGGQSQRVAIARALVTNPDIVLADEPTGALDSETSVQIMEILREIAKERLVIMVTHNAELADRYANRVITMSDGRILSDTHPVEEPKEPTEDTLPKRRVGMNLRTAFLLSMRNLLSKKGRTILTAFAGSIGIIGIALIFALSNGIQIYIDQLQEDTLAAYPIQIEAETVDTAQLIANLMQVEQSRTEEPLEEDRVYSLNVMSNMMRSMTSLDSKSNDLPPFKSFLENDPAVQEHISSIHYVYDLEMPLYTTDPNGEIFKADLLEMISDASGQSETQSAMMQRFSPLGQVKYFEELMSGEDGELIHPMLREQFEVLDGRWPQAYDETVLILNRNNRVSDMALYALGLKDRAELKNMFDHLADEEPMQEQEDFSLSFAEIRAKELKVLLPSETYAYNEEQNEWVDLSATDAGVDYLYHSEERGIPVKIVGIIRPKDDVADRMYQGAVGYTEALTKTIIERNEKSRILSEQKQQPTVDVFNGLPFRTQEFEEPTPEEKARTFADYAADASAAKRAEFFTWIAGIPMDEELESLLDAQLKEFTREQFEENVSGQYAEQMNVDEKTVRDYIASMDDDTLLAFVRDAMRERMLEQFRIGAEQNLAELPESVRAQRFDASDFSEEQYGKLYDEFMPPTISEATLADNLSRLGDVNPESPSRILLYTTSFRDKDAIADAITAYNRGKTDEEQITYTDYVALLMSSVTQMISGISYLLLAFVAISLVVSSIMIGIITYISVLERTKEIGILRAMGASKGDISRVFNAETIIEGLAAGILGIFIAWLLTLPINAIIHDRTEILTLNAQIPWQAAAVLVGISVLLTLIAGILPSRLAARMDPVEALRSE